jgi:hypothetical protein
MLPQSLARLIPLVSVALLAALAGDASPALGASFTVDATHDAVDATPGDGVCADAGGACTLRAAVMETNALAGADEITLPAGRYVLSIAGAGEDAAATGDLDVTGDVTIQGAGLDTTVVDGGGLDRVIHIVSGGVWISEVVVRNGVAGPSAAASACHPFPDQENGGGVCIEGGDATLVSVDVMANSADRHGSGVYNAANLLIEGSRVRANTGDGIVNDGSLTARRVETANNDGYGLWNRMGTADVEDVLSVGNFRGLVNWSMQSLSVRGGVFSDNIEDGIQHIGEIMTLADVTVSSNGRLGLLNGAGVPSDLVITGSTISGNSSSGIVNGGPTIAQRGSAGGLVPPEPGDVTLTNVTVSSNGVTDGHGIDNLGHLALTNVSIVENHGGGLFSLPGSVEADSRAVNAIIGRNAGSNCTGEVHVTSLGHNLDSDGTCGLTAASDVSNVDPQLGPLGDNGGPTQTHAVIAGSAAIDAGDGSACPATDQRGVFRPQDGDENGTPACDIGAFELEGPPPIPCPAGQSCPPCRAGPAGTAEAAGCAALPTPSPTIAPITLPRTGDDEGSTGGLWILIAAPVIAVSSSVGFLALRRVFTQR